VSNDGLPPIHLINLDRSPARLQSFREWNGHLKNVERVSASDGSALARSDLIRSGHVAADFVCGPGSLGCAISHIKLWELAAGENRALTIVEDDAIASLHFAAAARRVMSDLPPDWDFVKWGWTPNLGAWLDINGSRVRVQGQGKPEHRDLDTLRSFQAGAVAAAPIRMLQSFGLFGYSISPAGARAALQFCLPLCKRMVEPPVAGAATEAAGFDEILSAAYPRMRAFLCMPSLMLHSYGDESVRMQLDRAAKR
jgi:Glycosyltransferase family 25 (LPS biosynthesis protein)